MDRSTLFAVGRGVTFVVLFVALLLGSAYVHVATPAGRRALAEVITESVSGQIRGRLEVSDVQSAWLPYVHAGSLRATDPEGQDVLTLEDVRVHIDPWASLAERGFHVRRASVGGGTVHITESPHGDMMRIERAFDGVSSSGGSSGGDGEEPPPGARVLDIREIEYEGIHVLLAAGHAPIRFHVSSGQAHLWLRRHDDFQARFWAVNGDVESEVQFVPDATFEGVALTVDPRGPSSVRFAGAAQVLDDRVTLAGHAPQIQTGEGVRMCIWLDGVSLVAITGVAAEVVDGFSSALSFDVRPSAAPDPPRCEESS